MERVIRFTNGGADGSSLGSRHLAAAAAMRRYVPHVVEWACPEIGAPICVTLPEALSASELLHRAEHEAVRLAPVHSLAAPDRVFEIYYAHLTEDEIEEGIRRLGHCLGRYAVTATHDPSGQRSAFVGT